MTASPPILHVDDHRPAPPGVRLRGVGLMLPDGRRLFDGLDLDIEAGRLTCLLGPSGIGKSMLLKLILGIADVTGGATLSQRGSIAPSDGYPLSGRMAYMAQQDLLMPWLSVRRNVELGHRLRGAVGSDIVKRADSLLGAVGLSEQADVCPATLSGGMRQRVALARTLCEDRPVVLMDEPFSQLDAITRYRLQTMASTLLSDRTVLLITHDPLEALRLAHRIVVLTGNPAMPTILDDIAGSPPRDPGAPDMLRRQADLLAVLSGEISEGAP